MSSDEFLPGESNTASIVQLPMFSLLPLSKRRVWDTRLLSQLLRRAFTFSADTAGRVAWRVKVSGKFVKTLNHDVFCTLPGIYLFDPPKMDSLTGSRNNPPPQTPRQAQPIRSQPSKSARVSGIACTLQYPAEPSTSL